jgi:hypothetical protein
VRGTGVVTAKKHRNRPKAFTASLLVDRLPDVVMIAISRSARKAATSPFAA